MCHSCIVNSAHVFNIIYSYNHVMIPCSAYIASDTCNLAIACTCSLCCFTGFVLRKGALLYITHQITPSIKLLSINVAN